MIGVLRQLIVGFVVSFVCGYSPLILTSRAGTNAPCAKVADFADDAVRVRIFEGIPDGAHWNFTVEQAEDSYTEEAFGCTGMLQKFSSGGLKVDRKMPFLFTASSKVVVPHGERQILLRARGAARLWMDGKLVVATKFPNLTADGHEDVPDAPLPLAPGIRYLPPGHFESVTNFVGDGQAHDFILETIIAQKGRRPEIGELSVSLAIPGAMFHLLTPGPRQIALSEEHWPEFAEAQRSRLEEANRARRHAAGAAERIYWGKRHELARKNLQSSNSVLPSIPIRSSRPDENPIDTLIGLRLATNGVKPMPVIDDWGFLRRLALDTIGTIPTPEQIEAFQKDTGPGRRVRAIDRFLSHPGWADHWVSYWQDVLAENPGILKPTLNNTGPFRYWIHEAFADNKPMDQFATELVMMEGSVYYGGPGGFSLATENDVPMAAKAQVLAQAFLAMQMQCARCHDAPYHDFKQKDLFSLAAMLKRNAESVPSSSSIPTNANIVLGRKVNVTLAPGSKVPPAWPFNEIVRDEIESGVLRKPDDSREKLAAILTSPGNARFPKVIVNRLWKRYLGVGLVEPVDDWETAKPSHPELLDYLARELVLHNYDLKQVARLILTSEAYQRAVQPGEQNEPPLFAGSVRRRLSAEQVVDSMFVSVGKNFASEEMNLDVDGRRPVKDFNNLGVPKRAWEFTSLSNERDRPALAMPKAQALMDCLCTFGWRESRQSPLTVREEMANALQPAMLANGQVTYTRIARLCDENAVTEDSLRAGDLSGLVEKLFLRVLSRPPSNTEKAAYTELLKAGYAERLQEPSPGSKRGKNMARRPVSWSNHLNPEATRIKQELEREARAGDPPTDRLQTEWRERMEDAIWSLINSPEFVFVP